MGLEAVISLKLPLDLGPSLKRGNVFAATSPVINFLNIFTGMTTQRKASVTVVDENTVGVTSVFSQRHEHALISEGATQDELTLGALGYKQEFKRYVSSTPRPGSSIHAHHLAETLPFGNPSPCHSLFWDFCPRLRQQSRTAWDTRGREGPSGDGSCRPSPSKPLPSVWRSYAPACLPRAGSIMPLPFWRPKDGVLWPLGSWAGPTFVGL